LKEKSYEVAAISTRCDTYYTTICDRKAELTPGLARDRAATWRLIMNRDSQQRLKL